MDTLFFQASILIPLILSVALTRLGISLAHGLGMMDAPGHRKTHVRPMARTGGLSLFLALILGLAAALALGSALGRPAQEGAAKMEAVLAAALGAFLIGLADDRFDLRPTVKLGLQAFLALAFSFFCWRFEVFHLPGLRPVDLGLLSVPVTAFYLLAVVNGMNMIDGSDGLAGAVSVAAFLSLAMASAWFGEGDLTGLYLAAAGACLGFLWFNRAPARVFLGDAGSNGMGMLLAAALVALGSRGPQPPAWLRGAPGTQPFHYQILLAGLAAGWPALEVGFSFFRRVMHGRSPLRADQGHLHHRLRLLGVGPDATLLIAAGLTLVLGVVMVAFLAQQKGLAAVLALGVALTLGVSLPLLGFLDFLKPGYLGRRRPYYAAAHHFAALQSARLELSESLSETLAVVAQTCREFGLVSCRVVVQRPDGEQEPWIWRWQVGERLSGGQGHTDRCHQEGGPAAAVWVFETASLAQDLDMEARVLMAEFMQLALARVRDQFLASPPGDAGLQPQPDAEDDYLIHRIKRRLGPSGRGGR